MHNLNTAFNFKTYFSAAKSIELSGQDLKVLWHAQANYSKIPLLLQPQCTASSTAWRVSPVALGNASVLRKKKWAEILLPLTEARITTHVQTRANLKGRDLSRAWDMKTTAEFYCWYKIEKHQGFFFGGGVLKQTLKMEIQYVLQIHEK